MEHSENTPSAQTEFLRKMQVLPLEKRVKCLDLMIIVLMTANHIRDKEDFTELSTSMTRSRLLNLSQSLHGTGLYKEFCDLIGAKGSSIVTMEGLEAVAPGRAMPLAGFLHHIAAELEVARKELHKKSINDNASVFLRYLKRIFERKRTP